MTADRAAFLRVGVLLVVGAAAVIGLVLFLGGKQMSAAASITSLTSPNPSRASRSVPRSNTAASPSAK